MRKELFSLVPKSDGSSLANRFKSGKVELSIVFKEDGDKETTEQVKLIEAFTGSPMSAVLADQVQGQFKTGVVHDITKIISLMAPLMSTKVSLVSKWGMSSTRYAGFFLKDKGKNSW